MALTVFEHAVRVNPNNVTAWLCKITALVGLSRYEEALASCERAISIANSTHDKASLANARKTKSMVLKLMKQKSAARRVNAVGEKDVESEPGTDAQTRAFFRFVLGPIGWFAVWLFIHFSTVNGWFIGLYLVPLAVCVLVTIYFTGKLLSPLSFGGSLALAAIPWLVGLVVWVVVYNIAYNILSPDAQQANNILNIVSIIWAWIILAAVTFVTIAIEDPKSKPNTLVEQRGEE